MQSERDLVGMRYTPGDNALEFNGVVGDGADFHQLGFDDFRVSHRLFSMAQGALSEITFRLRGAGLFHIVTGATDLTIGISSGFGKSSRILFCSSSTTKLLTSPKAVIFSIARFSYEFSTFFSFRLF
jgi:hypothetical protein